MKIIKTCRIFWKEKLKQKIDNIKIVRLEMIIFLFTISMVMKMSILINLD